MVWTPNPNKISKMFWPPPPKLFVTIGPRPIFREDGGPLPTIFGRTGDPLPTIKTPGHVRLYKTFFVRIVSSADQNRKTGSSHLPTYLPPGGCKTWNCLNFSRILSSIRRFDRTDVKESNNRLMVSLILKDTHIVFYNNWRFLLSENFYIFQHFTIFSVLFFLIIWGKYHHHTKVRQVKKIFQFSRLIHRLSGDPFTKLMEKS